MNTLLLDESQLLEALRAGNEGAFEQFVELAAIVRDKLDRLRSNYRTVLVQRDIEGLSTEETARRMKITTDAAKVRMHRARQALRKLLEERFADWAGTAT